MSDHTIEQQAGEAGLVRSGVKIETNSKGMAQVKVAIYEGTTQDEAQRIKDLAVQVYETTIRELGQRADFK